MKSLQQEVPAFLQAELEADPSHPVRALLEVFEENVSGIEQRIERIEKLFGPESLSELELGAKENEFLQWLGSWVALELDRDWLDPVGSEFVPRNLPAIELIRDVARLYARRGTPEGMRTILERLYGRKVEILERCWVRPAQLELCSSLGVNFWVLGESRLEESFVVVLEPTEAERLEWGDAVQAIEATVERESSEVREVNWLLRRHVPEDLLLMAAPAVGGPEVERRPVAGVSDSWSATVDRVRLTVEREKPAHLRYYLALALEPRAARAAPGGLSIGVHAAIGEVWIG